MSPQSIRPKAPQFRRVGSVLSRKLKGNEVVSELGANPDVAQLKTYIANNVAKEFDRVIAGEKLITAMNKVDAVAVHLSFSWR